MLVVADATPLHYLILIGEIDLLRKLYGRVLIPASVVEELSVDKTPAPVRAWVAQLPSWSTAVSGGDPRSWPFPSLGRGEREAMMVARDTLGSLLLTDDLQARLTAASIGIQSVPTIRILSTAGDLALIDFDEALQRLQQTNFRLSRKTLSTISHKPKLE